MGKGSHSQEKISGRKKQGCFGPPVTEMSPMSPFPYTVPAATASSLPPPLNVPYLQVVQDFFFSFLSLFFLFKFFFTQSMAAARWWGPGGWQQLFVCMGPLSFSFVSQGLSVYIIGGHLARHLVPSMLFKYFLDDIINA